jgi:hypothetical protein
MTVATLTIDEARIVAAAHAAASYPMSLDVVVADVTPLADERGWVAWLQSAAYRRSHDPLDFVVCAPLLIRPGQALTELPTAFPVSVSLASLGLALTSG